MMSDNASQQLGNYRLLHLIGEGGFARVYLGEHIYLKTYAALKVPKMLLNQEDLDAFLAEARRSVSLEHPHIVRVLECGVEGGTIPYFVMNYAPGGTVRRRYTRGTLLPPAIIYSYTRQIASALQYIHHRGLIHQDIKPENMLLGLNDEIMLSDFGISAVAHRTVTMSVQEVTGTARYMAPEQFQGIARPASDQYALAVVVYEWICGTTPFNGTFIELYSQHLNVAPPSLREKVPELSPATEQVILKALAKDPRQRFARVQDFVDALDQARQASYLYSQMGLTSVPTLPDSNVQQNEENTPAMLRGVPVSQISQPSGSVPVPPGPTIGEDEEDIPTLISGGHRVIQETNGHKAVQEKEMSKAKRRGSSRRMVVFLIGLVIVVVAGSIAFFASGLLRGKSFNQLSSNTGQPTTPYVPPSYSPMFGFNTLHTRFNPDESIINATNVSGLTNYWTAPTGSLINSSPVVANGVAFISSTDHELYAIDARTGKKLWTALNTTSPSDRGSFIYSTPMVVNGVVYIGSTDHHLYAIDARTGKILWTAATGDAIFSSPTVVNGKVYIGSDDHKLYAFNASGCGGQPTCTSLWTATTGSNIVSSPAVVNGVVYIGSWDHKLYAFDANNGSTLWTARVSWKISSSPAVVKGLIYVGSEAGDGLFYVYKASGCGQTTCQPIWVDAAGGWIDSSPAVANDMVYIGSHDNKLYAFKASGCGATLCSPAWTQPTGGPIESAPAVANGVVYVGSWDGKLYAFDAGTGTPLWSYQTGAKITASPTVVNGVVYISSNDSKLYAFHLPGTS